MHEKFRNAYRILVGKPNGNQIQKPGHFWGNNTEDLKDVGCKFLVFLKNNDNLHMKVALNSIANRQRRKAVYNRSSYEHRITALDLNQCVKRLQI